MRLACLVLSLSLATPALGAGGESDEKSAADVDPKLAGKGRLVEPTVPNRITPPGSRAYMDPAILAMMRARLEAMALSGASK